MRGWNIGEGYITSDADNVYVNKSFVNESQLVRQNDVIIVASTGSEKVIGRAGISAMDYQDVSFGAFLMLVRPTGKFNPKYLDFFFQSDDYRNQIKNLASGVNINNIRAEYITNMPIPVPPLVEQQRIIDRIESLFSKLDKAKKKAQTVLDGFELRKSVILHKAFTGELTEKWRQIHNVRFDNWETKRINEITKPRAGYAFSSKKFTNSGYQIIRMGNMYAGELDLTRNPVFISKEDVDETMLKKAIVNDGDILITLTGTKYKRDYGYAVCVFNTENLLVNQRILCLTPSPNVIRNYILYYLRSNIFRDIFFSNETGGVNQGNVSSKFVENIGIKVPSLIEQHEIVAILDRLLDKEQQARKPPSPSLPKSIP